VAVQDGGRGGGSCPPRGDEAGGHLPPERDGERRSGSAARAADLPQPAREHREPLDDGDRTGLPARGPGRLAGGAHRERARREPGVAVRGGEAGRDRLRPDVPPAVRHSDRHPPDLHDLRSGPAGMEGDPVGYPGAAAGRGAGAFERDPAAGLDLHRRRHRGLPPGGTCPWLGGSHARDRLGIHRVDPRGGGNPGAPVRSPDGAPLRGAPGPPLAGGAGRRCRGGARLGWQPTVSLEEGLARTVAWHRERALNNQKGGSEP